MYFFPLGAVKYPNNRLKIHYVPHLSSKRNLMALSKAEHAPIVVSKEDGMIKWEPPRPLCMLILS